MAGLWAPSILRSTNSAVLMAPTMMMMLPTALTKTPSSLFTIMSFSSPPSSDSLAQVKIPLRVGFLGLDIMGSPMAKNLINAGCDVTVWNRTKSKCDQLLDLGARYKSSPMKVVSPCDVTFAMLADRSEFFFFGSIVNHKYIPHHHLRVSSLSMRNGMAAEKGYVDVSTVDGDTSKAIREDIKATGAMFLEVIGLSMKWFHPCWTLWGSQGFSLGCRERCRNETRD